VANVESGSAVKVHYTGKLEDGTVFDTSEDREPLGFTVGEGQVIPGFEKAVMGMEPGDSTTTEVPPEEGYGERREDLVVQVALDRISDDIAPEVGQQLQLRLNDGRTVPVIVRSVNEGTVTIDANHPLAGKKLVFDIEVVDVGANGESDAADEE
jgi:peptidylprolyl isomerase/FKBP-type peptidyl-prolyl cis-trans isomerase SlpA